MSYINHGLYNKVWNLFRATYVTHASRGPYTPVVLQGVHTHL